MMETASRLKELISTQDLKNDALAHELRTPLSRIRLNEIRQNIDDTEDLISAKLDYSLFQKKHNELDYQSLELKECLENAIQGYRHI